MGQKGGERGMKVRSSVKKLCEGCKVRLGLLLRWCFEGVFFGGDGRVVNGGLELLIEGYAAELGDCDERGTEVEGGQTEWRLAKGE